MSTYEDAPQAKINDNSLLNVISEIEAEFDIIPGTINDLQGKLVPVLRVEQDVPTNGSKDINPVSSNSMVYDRLVDILERVRGAKYRIHEITDRVQL